MQGHTAFRVLLTLCTVCNAKDRTNLRQIFYVLSLTLLIVTGYHKEHMGDFYNSKCRSWNCDNDSAWYLGLNGVDIAIFVLLGTIKCIGIDCSLVLCAFYLLPALCSIGRKNYMRQVNTIQKNPNIFAVRNLRYLWTCGWYHFLCLVYHLRRFGSE